MDWENQKKWSDKFLPEIQAILGLHLIGEPEEVKEDIYHNTDLIIIDMEPSRIACRVRENRYLEKYGKEFTIRSCTKTEMKTEIHKIQEGWGDYMFYGFASKDESCLEKWALLNLNIFRKHTNFNNLGKSILNYDGSGFHAFKVKDYPPNLLVAWWLKGFNNIYKTASIYI